MTPQQLTEQFSAPLLAIVKAIGTEQCSLKVKVITNNLHR